MIDEIRRRIDKIENILVGKVPDPKSQVDIITVTMIYKFMDDMDLISLKLPNGKRAFFSVDNGIDYEKYAWSNLMKTSVEAGERAKLFRDGIESIWKNSKLPSLFSGIFKNAFIPIKSPETLNLFLKEMDYFNYKDSEVLGDAFEYLLSKMSSQGDAGQFRTPRHIIDMIVEIVDPQKNETIKDVACGTAGFLISSFLHILKANTKDGENILTPKEREKLSNNIAGYDISPDMVKFSKVNLYLHHFNDPQIYEYDTLTNTEKWNDKSDVMLANPPFMSPTGGIKPHNLFKIKANRSEVLFVDYIIEHLNSKGRAGVIVPEGIIFNNKNSYKKLRRDLINENFLYAVVSLPNGIFQPYSNNKTNILFMDRELAAKNKNILFIKIEKDGFSLGSQRKEIKENDIPRTIELLKRYKKAILGNESFELSEEEKKYTNLISKENIAKSEDYSFSVNKYVHINKDKSNWVMTKLEDICEIKSGGTPCRSEKKYWGGDIPWVCSNVCKDKEIYTSEEFITNDGLKNSSAKLFPINTTLVALVGATIGKTGLLKFESTTNQNIAGIYPKSQENLNSIFLFYMVRKLYPEFIRLGDGKFRMANLSFIRKLKIPLLPLEIQQQIVAKLDSYQRIIDGARQVVNNWKPVFDIDPEWTETPIKDVAFFQEGPGILSSQFVSDGYPIINVGNVRDGYLDLKKTKYVNNEIANGKWSHFIIDENDILFTTSGTIGRSAMVKKQDLPLLLNTSVVRFKPLDINELNTDFLYYSLKSERFVDSLLRLKTGSGQFNVGPSHINLLNIFIPPLNIQQNIVDKLKKEELIINSCKILISEYENKIRTVIEKLWNYQTPLSEDSSPSTRKVGEIL